MQRWQSLLEEIRVPGSGRLYTFSEEEIVSFEALHGITLPKDYRDFCKTFGSGSVGSSLTIYCLPGDQSDVADFRQEMEDSKDVEGSELSYRIRDGEALDLTTTSRILDHAFVFGHTDGGESLIWDLQSYSSTDDSYDIYMTRLEDFPGVSKVGRNFFEFVQLYGLGIGDSSHLPDWTQHNPDGVGKTFEPYGKSH